MAMRMGIREKTYYCQGTSESKKPDYIEIDLFPFVDVKYKPCRSGRQKATTPKQKNLNDKKARRYFRLLAKSNFGSKDIHLTLSYDNDNLPDTPEQGEKRLRNYMRRLKRLYKANGKELKYIYVTEVSSKGRVHHHLLINRGVDRDAIEKAWGHGWANSKRIQAEHGGIEALVCYLSKDPKGRKRYTSSRNLVKPLESVSDTKTSRKQFQQLTLWPEGCEDMQKHFEQKHPDYRIISVEKYYNAVTCEWYIRAKMELRDDYKRKKGDIANALAHREGWRIPEPEEKIVLEVVAFWPDGRRRDMNNTHKLLCDALEGAVYLDDKMVLVRDMDFFVDRKRPRLEVCVYVKDD